MLPYGQCRIQHVQPKGEGGLGIVDEVVVVETNCVHPVGARFARKRLNDKWRNQPDAKVRFEREIEILSGMNHERIVSFQGQSIPGEERFYMMPLYERSVRNYLLAAPGGVNWRNAARFCSELADALHYAHMMGHIHRDLKPENILLDIANNAVISDWGLGQFVHRDSKVLDLTRGGMGTEYYVSLEQWTTGRCESTGDVYSLGIVLAELVRGANRISIVPGMGISGDVVAGNADGSSEFNQYIRTMTAIFPTARPQSMADVAATLNRLAQVARAA